MWNWSYRGKRMVLAGHRNGGRNVCLGNYMSCIFQNTSVYDRLVHICPCTIVLHIPQKRHY